jgi:hypothetical protein
VLVLLLWLLLLLMAADCKQLISYATACLPTSTT